MGISPLFCTVTTFISGLIGKSLYEVNGMLQSSPDAALPFWPATRFFVQLFNPPIYIVDWTVERRAADKKQQKRHNDEYWFSISIREQTPGVLPAQHRSGRPHAGWGSATVSRAHPIDFTAKPSKIYCEAFQKYPEGFLIFSAMQRRVWWMRADV